MSLLTYNKHSDKKGDFIVRCDNINTTTNQILSIDNTIIIDPIGTTFLLLYTTWGNAMKIETLGINISYDEPCIGTC